MVPIALTKTIVINKWHYVMSIKDLHAGIDGNYMTQLIFNQVLYQQWYLRICQVMTQHKQVLIDPTDPNMISTIVPSNIQSIIPSSNILLFKWVALNKFDKIWQVTIILLF